MLTPRRSAVLAYFDRVRQPTSVEEAFQEMTKAGHALNRSTIYRLVAELTRTGLMLELKVGHERARYLPSHLAVSVHVEDPDGQVLQIQSHELQSLLTGLAAEAGLSLGSHVKVQFST